MLNEQLKNNNWLANDKMSLADFAMYQTLVPAFQLFLDAGFRKAMPGLSEWFDKMSKLPSVVRSAGFIKPCVKQIK
jgi:glutathione S-transferase